MFKCVKCNKEFKYESDLNRHKNRKTPCNKKEELKCNYCNVSFTCPYNKSIHEKTKKHINNYNTYINGNQNNTQVGDNNIQNIIQLTLNTNTFINTNVLLVSNLSVELIYGIYNEIIDNKNLLTYNKAVTLFKEAVIFILDTLHFNLSNTENHNLKILLMFPKIDKLVYEYLILEIHKETNDLVWNSINYDQLLQEIFNLLSNINLKNIEKHNDTVRDKNIVFNNCIDFLKNNLLDDEENKLLAKPEIEQLLNDLYIKFNKNQKKSEREVELNIFDKIKEYKQYREDECRLSNGYTPEIINSNIKKNN